MVRVNQKRLGRLEIKMVSFHRLSRYLRAWDQFGHARRFESLPPWIQVGVSNVNETKSPKEKIYSLLLYSYAICTTSSDIANSAGGLVAYVVDDY